MSTILECLSKIERPSKLLSMSEINLFFAIFSTVTDFFVSFFFFFVLRNRGCSMKVIFNAYVSRFLFVSLTGWINKFVGDGVAS